MQGRFIGFALAGGDALIESTVDGEVQFARGATEPLFDASPCDICGSSLAAWFKDAYGPTLRSALGAAPSGARKGEIFVQTKTGASVELSFFADPDSHARVFLCVRASRDLELFSDVPEMRRFVSAAISATVGSEADAELTLFDLQATVLQDEEVGEGLRAELDAVLRSYLQANALRPETITKLPSGQYAFLHRAGLGLKDVIAEVESAAGTIDPVLKRVRVRAGSLAVSTLRQNRSFAPRVLERVLTDVCKQAFSSYGAKDVSETFRKVVHATSGRMGRIARMFVNHDFRLNIQPIVSLADERISHHEVLSQFKNEQSPFDTVTFAEDTALIQELDTAVLKRTLEALTSGRAPVGGGLAVNISGISLQSPAFIQNLLDMYGRSAAATGKLLIEITESAKIENLEQARYFVDQVRRAGIAVCLDDFGTGAASFQHLQALDVDCVKIDGLYVTNMLSSGKEYSMIRALADLCRDLNIATVAEYVEMREHAEALKRLNIDFAQGFYYGRPVPFCPAPVARSRTTKQESLVLGFA